MKNSGLILALAISVTACQISPTAPGSKTATQGTSASTIPAQVPTGSAQPVKSTVLGIPVQTQVSSISYVSTKVIEATSSVSPEIDAETLRATLSVSDYKGNPIAGLTMNYIYGGVVGQQAGLPIEWSTTEPDPKTYAYSSGDEQAVIDSLAETSPGIYSVQFQLSFAAGSRLEDGEVIEFGVKDTTIPAQVPAGLPGFSPPPTPSPQLPALILTATVATEDAGTSTSPQYVVNLNWDSIASADYSILAGTSTNSLNTITSNYLVSTAYTDTTLQAGATQSYQIRALDNSTAVELERSNIVTVVVP